MNSSPPYHRLPAQYTHYGYCFWLDPAALVFLFLVSDHRAHIHLLSLFSIGNRHLITWVQARLPSRYLLLSDECALYGQTHKKQRSKSSQTIEGRVLSILRQYVDQYHAATAETLINFFLSEILPSLLDCSNCSLIIPILLSSHSLFWDLPTVLDRGKIKRVSTIKIIFQILLIFLISHNVTLSRPIP